MGSGDLTYIVSCGTLASLTLPNRPVDLLTDFHWPWGGRCSAGGGGRGGEEMVIMSASCDPSIPIPGFRASEGAKTLSWLN